MATKTELLNETNVGDAILAAAKCEHLKTQRFDVVVCAPDDRRVDKLFGEDKGLRKEMSAACAGPYNAYVATMAAFVAAEEKAWNKQKGEERKTFEKQYYARQHKAGKDAAKAMETAILRDTQKIWKKAAAGKSDLKGVEFEALLVPFLPAFDFPAAAKTEAEEGEEELGKDIGLDLIKLQMDLDQIIKEDLRRAVVELPKVAGTQAKVNEFLKKLAADYESGPRESQKDNPETSGDEEPDEAALNDALFAEHGAAIRKASGQATDLYISCSNSAEDCAAASKSLVKLIRKTGKVSSAANADTSSDIGKVTDKWGDAVKKLVALQSALKTELRPIKNSMGIFEALEAGKGGALGLLDRATLALADRSAAIKEIVKILDDNRIGSRMR